MHSGPDQPRGRCAVAEHALARSPLGRADAAAAAAAAALDYSYWQIFTSGHASARYSLGMMFMADSSWNRSLAA